MKKLNPILPTLLLLFCLIFSVDANAQGGTCVDIDPFCADVNSSLIFANCHPGDPLCNPGAEVGPDYNCLITQPYPAWFFLQIDQSGDLNFQIIQNTNFDAGGNPIGAGLDVDFICWGPFQAGDDLCDYSQLQPANEIACSFSPAPIENFTINGGVSGEVYVLVITNFDQGAGFIKLEQTNTGIPGSGNTDCSILFDETACEGEVFTIDATTTDAVSYTWYFEDPLGSGVFVPFSPPETNPTLNVTQTGNYQVEILLSSGTTNIEITEVTFFPNPTIEAPAIDLSICNTGGIPGIFDLTVNTPIVLGAQDPTLFNVTYLDSAGTLIGTPGAYNITGTNETITVQIEDLAGNCTATDEFEIDYIEITQFGMVPDYTACDIDGNGSEDIDLHAEFDIVVYAGAPTSDFLITYHLTQAAADADGPDLPNPITVVGSIPIFVRYESNIDSTCYETQSFQITVVPLPNFNPTPDPLIVCDIDNDGFAEFTLTDADVDITAGDPDLVVTYHGTLIDAQIGQLPLTIPYTNDVPYNDIPITDPLDPLYGTGGVWARVESVTTGCAGVASLALEVRDSPVAVTPAEPLRECDDDGTQDGFRIFDLTVVEPEVLGGMSPVEFDIYYYEDETDAINAGDVALTAPDFSLAIATPTNYLNTGNPQTIYILVVGNVNSTMPNNGASGCYDIVELELIVDPLPEDFGPFEMMLCDDELNGSTSDDEVSTFDLTSQDAAATGGDDTLVVTWYETPADEAANNPIMGPDMYQNTSTPQTVIGRVTTEQGCSITITLTLTVLPNPTPNQNPTPLELCDDDDDGLVGGFLLTDRDAEIIDGEPDVNVLYYEGLQEAIDAVAGTEIVSPYTNITPNTQVVYARVTRDTPPATVPCYSIVELTLNVIALPDMPDATFRDPFLSCDTDGSGQAVFDLTEQDTAVLGAQDAVDFEPITYHPSQVDADMNTNAIDPADAYVSTGGETIWVRLESLVTGCARVTPFDLVVGAFPTIGVGNDLFECDDELNGSTPDDGISTFDLTVNTALINLGDDTLVVEYYATAADQAAGVAIADPTAYQNTVSSPQQEVFVSAFNGEGCAASNSFFLNVEPNPAPLEPTALIACDDDNDGFFADFLLTDKDAEVINGDVDVTVSYYETLVDAQAGDPADMLLSPYANIVPFSQTIYARVVRDVPPGVNPCFAIVPMELRVELLPNPPDPELFLDPMEECDDDADGFAVFDLTRQDNAVLSTQDSPMDFLPVSYHETEADAEAGTNAVPSPDAYTNLGTPQTIWVRAENSLTGCYLVTPFGLVVNPLPVLGTGPFEMAECDDEENGSTPDDGISTFDLTLNNLAITGGDDSYSVSYYLSVADQDSGNAIADPTAHQNMDPITGASINPQDIFVTVFTGPGCEARTDLTLRVLPNPTPSTPQPLQICDGDGDPTVDIDDSDGLSIFDLTQKDAEIINGEPGVGVLYYEDLALAELGDPLDAIVDPTIYENTTPGSQIVYARVTRDVPPGELPCFTIVELELLVNPLPDGSADIPDLVACEFAADDIAVFDLTERDADALNGQDPLLFTVTYYRSLTDAQTGIAPILDPTAFPNTVNPQPIFVRVTDSGTGCFRASEEDPVTGEASLSFDLEVKEAAAANAPALPYEICDNFGENDGVGAFTLISDPANPTDLDAEADALRDEILNGQDPAIYVLTYHETLENAESGTDPLPNVYNNVVNPQVIYARVTNEADPADGDACFAVVEVLLSVVQPPVVQLEEEYRLCVDNGVAIPEEDGDPSPPLIDTGLDASLYIFAWTINGVLQPNAVEPSIVALEGGGYEVRVTDMETGCSTVAATTVILSSPPQEYTVDVTSNAFDSEHVIEVTATGEGQYEYQLDDGPFQESNIFTGVEPGTHTVTIRDVNGCGSVTEEVGIIDYPRLVTPNQDGFHDTWNIIGIASGDPTAKIYIFDRFGKLLKQISPLGPGWDGTYNGNPLPSSDYWFRVEYMEDEASKEFTGHFTLKR